MQPDNSSLTKISQLSILVDIDKADHKRQDIAPVFLNASTDWNTFNQTNLSANWKKPAGYVIRDNHIHAFLEQ